MPLFVGASESYDTDAWEAYDLKKENANLRERIAELEELTDGKRYIPQEWYQLATTENAKLRGLLRDVYLLHEYGADCTECPWFDGCDNHGGGCPWLGILADRMSELGIEVE